MCSPTIYFLTHSQDQPPFNRGAFRIEIVFPAEYPFKPPKVESRGLKPTDMLCNLCAYFKWLLVCCVDYIQDENLSPEH